MEVIKSNAWEGEGLEVPQNSFFFGVRDLTSDYYQVMIQKGRPRWCKVLWSVITAGLLVFTGYVTYLMVSDYLSYGAYDRVETVPGKNVTLPSITICNVNPINYAALKADMKGTALDDEYWEWLVLYTMNYESIQRNTGTDEIIERDESNTFDKLKLYEKEHGMLTMKYKNDATSLLSKTSTRYEYQFNRRGVTIDNWLSNVGVNELGSCLELNDDKSLVQTVGGSDYGFTIDLDTHTDMYSLFTKSAGFKVFIKDHDETAFFNDGGYIVAPGTETFMEITLNKIKRLPAPWGSCENVKSRVSKFNATLESRQECYNLAYLQEYLDFEACRCIPWFVVSRLMDLGKTKFLDDLIDNSPYYQPLDRKKRGTNGRKKRFNDEWDTKHDVDKQDYIDEYGEDAEEWLDDYDGIDDYITKGSKYKDFLCNSYQDVICDIKFSSHWGDIKSMYDTKCMEPCTYNRYDVSMSTSKYPPSEIHFTEVIKGPDSDVYTLEYAKENLVRLHIYYDKISFRTNTQTKDYEAQNFIGELGGTVDLFIGFSFFTIFQLLEIGLAFLLFKCCGKRRVSEGAEGDTVTQIKEGESKM